MTLFEGIEMGDVSIGLVVQCVVCSVVLQNVLVVVFMYYHQTTHKTWATHLHS